MIRIPEVAFSVGAVVELIEDLPDEGLRSGQIGAIVDEYTDPRAFEVEFDDEDGVQIALLALKPEQVRLKYSAVGEVSS